MAMSFHPQTPQSPSHFSPATSSDPTTAAAPGAMSVGVTTLPTPAHSVSGSISHPDTINSDESPHKRKRNIDDVGDRDQKKVHLDDMGLGIGELHLDVGEKYLLCQIRKAPFVDAFVVLMAMMKRCAMPQSEKNLQWNHLLT